jgi:hypothetical protein
MASPEPLTLRFMPITVRRSSDRSQSTHSIEEFAAVGLSKATVYRARSTKPRGADRTQTLPRSHIGCRRHYSHISINVALAVRFFASNAGRGVT